MDYQKMMKQSDERIKKLENELMKVYFIYFIFLGAAIAVTVTIYLICY